jgi:hypothetical protein
MLNRTVEEANDEFNNNQTFTAYMMRRVICLPAALVGEILLDNQSQEHIFGNENMITDIRDAPNPVTFEGIGGQMVVNKIATFPPLGVVVYFDERSPANLLSFGKIKKEGRHLKVLYDEKHDVFSIQSGAYEPLKFENRDNLYVLQSRMYSYPTWTELEKQFRPRDVHYARQARQLHKRLGYPSEQRMVHGIRTGCILNSNVTGQDVERMHHIYGPSAAMLQGKSTK